MATFRLPRPRERVVWALTAALALGGCMLGAGLFARPVAPADSVLASIASPAPPAPKRSVAVAEDGAALFRTRLRAFAPLEAALRRAFAEPRLILARAQSPAAPLRVHAGATPQACLAQAVYYEARGEPEAGQAAVAQVVMNRTRSGHHPSSVCGVVFEGASHAGCQFSFACDPRLGGRRPESVSWRRAEQIAANTLAGQESEGLRDAVNYHADYVRPGWAGRLQRAAAIGRHIFYAAIPAAAPPPVYAAGE